MTGVLEVLMNIARWISSRLDWSRPSSWLLAAVVVANLLMAVVHLASAPDPVADSGDLVAAAAPEPEAEAEPEPEPEPEPVAPEAEEPPASDEPRRDVQPAAERTSPPAPSLPVEPVAVPALARREPPGPEGVCRRWAPVASAAEAEALAERLDLEDYDIVPVGEAGAPEFLVWVQAPLDAEGAGQAMEVLAGAGVDSYVLQRTEQATVLAVGVFSSRSRAENHLSRMQELGFEGAMNTLGKAPTAHVLRAVVPADWAGAVAFEGPCGDIAPAQ